MSAMDKVNNILGKLPFVKLAEKIPSGIIGKIPVLQTLVPFANHIAVGLLVVVLVANVGGGGGTGGGGSIRALTEERAALEAQRRELFANDTPAIERLLARIARVDEQLQTAWADASAKGASFSGEHETLNRPEQFQYDLTEDGAGVRIDKMLYETEIIPLIINIPAEIEGYPVVEIGRGAIAEERVISITLPSSITKLEMVAFEGARITKIILPPGITEISGECFGYTNLTSITIPASVTVIEGGAFLHCHNLTEVTIPEGVITIGIVAFSACNNLTEVTIPESVTSIGQRAFEDCPELTTVNMPPHPIEYKKTAIEDNAAFRNCPKLSLAVRKAIQDTGYTDSF